MKSALMFVLLLAVAPQSWCTTIIFRRDSSRILVAADKRVQHVLPIGDQVTDDKVKLLILGRVGFAMRDNAGYDGGPADSLNSWDNFHDAQTAFALYGNDTEKVADEWASKAITHYSEWYRMNPATVTKIAGGSSGVLVTSVFLTWQDGTPKALIRYVNLDSRATHPVYSSAETKTLDEKESSLNGLTQNLIEHTYEPMRERWDVQKKTIKRNELAWRHLRFLVEETSHIDNLVSPNCDILEIPRKGKPKWVRQ